MVRCANGVFEDECSLVKAFVKGKNRIDKACLQCRNGGDSISILVS